MRYFLGCTDVDVFRLEVVVSDVVLVQEAQCRCELLEDAGDGLFVLNLLSLERSQVALAGLLVITLLILL